MQSVVKLIFNYSSFYSLQDEAQAGKMTHTGSFGKSQCEGKDKLFIQHILRGCFATPVVLDLSFVTQCVHQKT